MFKKILFFILIIAPFMAYSEITPVVKPAISPDGKSIAFSFQGDIWIMPFSGGEAKRLTIHEAYETNPVWSPDSKHIAFNSNRFGNNDLYVIPVTGGTPKRITSHSSADALSDWAPDNSLLFTSNRSYHQVEWDAEMHKVPAKGGTPIRFMDAFGKTPVMSPNKRFIAFVRGSCRNSREAYNGPANTNIWIYDTQMDTYNKLEVSDYNEYNPLWKSDNSLYFISAKTGRYNVYELSINANGKAEGSPKAYTNFKDYGVSAFSVSDDGKIVAERMGQFYTLQQASVPKKLNIDLGVDYRFDPIEHKTFSSDLNEYAVSPNGKLIAIGVRGEIFVFENDKDKNRAVNISDHPYRDQSPTWLNDSVLLFLSDRDGQYDIYMASSADDSQGDLFKTMKRKLERVTKTAVQEQKLLISPDRKKIAYTEGFGKLIVADIDERAKMANHTVLLDSWDSPGGLSWSPDSKWLAYSLSDLYFNSEIFIHAADNSGEPVNISMHPRGDYSPVWSPDGSKLAFVSVRNNGDQDIWFAWLTEKDWEKTKTDWEEDEPELKKSKGKSKGVVPIQIDFDNIHERLVQVTSLPGEEGGVVIEPKGEYFYFTTTSNVKRGRDIYKIKWDGSKISQISKDGENPFGLSLASDQNIYFVKRGMLFQLNLKSGKPAPRPFSAKMNINKLEERKQIFNEAWTILNHRFYDPNFHGVDYKKLKKDFQDIAVNASTKNDFYYFFNLMLGQLNASHMGLRGPTDEETQRERTGLIGVEIEPLKRGAKITRIVKGSPADKEDSKLNTGDVVLSVDGVDVTPDVNFFELFTNKVDEKVLLSVQSDGGVFREIIIRPVQSLRNELYDEWVDEKRALTEKYSGGKLGYIHIQGMNWPSFERFERELTAAAYGKEGLVVDVRYNGGGWTTDYLMLVLSVQQHAYTIPRGAVKNLEKEHKQYTEYYAYGERLPYAAWTKPVVAMCNESSYSNAEIFSHAFKSTKRGKLVGMPTFGAVISTGGARLLDGSFVRVPFRAWYVKPTEKNMEHGPAVPDYILPNSPDCRAKNVDEQLKKAVEVLLNDR